MNSPLGQRYIWAVFRGCNLLFVESTHLEWGQEPGEPPEVPQEGPTCLAAEEKGRKSVSGTKEMT